MGREAGHLNEFVLIRKTKSTEELKDTHCLKPITADAVIVSHLLAFSTNCQVLPLSTCNFVKGNFRLWWQPQTNDRERFGDRLPAKSLRAGRALRCVLLWHAKFLSGSNLINDKLLVSSTPHALPLISWDCLPNTLLPLTCLPLWKLQTKYVYELVEIISIWTLITAYSRLENGSSF